MYTYISIVMYREMVNSVIDIYILSIRKIYDDVNDGLCILQDLVVILNIKQKKERFEKNR